MLTFLSPAWIDALRDAAVDNQHLAELSAEVTLTIEQEVTGGPEGDVCYHITLDRGSVTVQAGRATDATVRFSQDYETAAAIATGTGSAQRAFMAGRLRIGGDLRVLLEHGEALTQVEDVFAAVRARTKVPSTP